MSKTILLRGARQLLTLRGPDGPRCGAAMSELAIIQDGALLIRDGIIREVGPSRRVENLAEAAEALELDATGKVVLPGFVDCHTHLISGPPQLEAQPGAGPVSPGDRSACLQRAAAQVRTHTIHRMEMEARRLLRQFVRNGTTTVEAKSGFGLDQRTELKCLRAFRMLDQRPLTVIPTYHALHAVPPDDDPERYAAWVAGQMVPLVRKRRLARYVEISCGDGIFQEQQAWMVAREVQASGLGLKVHALGECPEPAVRVAVQAGAVSLDGLTYAGKVEIGLLAGSGVIATLLPGVSFHLGHPMPPARGLIDAGVAVALASGYSNTSSPTCSMPMVMALACRHMGMTAAEAVTAATINSAWAAGEGRCAGSLEPGKKADLAIFGVPDYREIAHYFGMNMLVMTMKQGEPLFPRLEALG